MEIYLVRHADAVEADQGMADEDRPLSEEGREKMRKGSKGLRNLLSADNRLLDAVLSSPKVRAMETARILAREAARSDEVAECPSLAGEYGWADLVPHLERHPADARVALVGHEPELGRLAGWLIARQEDAEVPLKKGSIICFELDGPLADPVAELHWFLTPKQLRLLR